MIRSMLLSMTLLVPVSIQAASPVDTAQSLFDAMLKHDGESSKTLFTPEATMTSVHTDGKATVTPFSKFLERIANSKDTLLERMWNPTVLEQGPLAVIWAKYDFHVNGKFHHCGVDTFNLVKTDAGWKIASVAWTSETSGCEASPLGPPR